PRSQEAPVHRARPHLPRAHHPGDQHVDLARRRDGDEHRPPRKGVRYPLLQPGADDGARRSRARDHVERRDHQRSGRVRDRLWQERGAGERPSGLHRQRVAVPVPQQRGASLRRGRRDARRHRRRDEGRLQLPDGSARAARPRRSRHEPGDPRSALRGIQGPELCGRARAAPHGERGASRPEDGPGLLRVQAVTGSPAPERTAGRTGRPPELTTSAVGRSGRMEPMTERDRPWLIRTYSGHSSARASNELYRTNLAKGQTGLSVAFDLPTQTGYDPDSTLARGEVGKVGVPVPHLGEMRTLFDGIPLGEMNTSMTINATAMWLLGMYLALADEQGVEHAALAGTT